MTNSVEPLTAHRNSILACVAIVILGVACLLLNCSRIHNSRVESCREFLLVGADTSTWNYNLYFFKAENDNCYHVLSRKEPDAADASIDSCFVPLEMDSTYCLTLRKSTEPPTLHTSDIGLYQSDGVVYTSEVFQESCSGDSGTVFWLRGSVQVDVYESDDIVGTLVRKRGHSQSRSGSA